MWQWLLNNAQTLGPGILAICGLAWGAWQTLLKNKVDKANANADVAIADSQKEVYSQMRERLSDLAAQVNTLSSKVDELTAQGREKDNRIHALELYIKDLLHLMQVAGIDPPKMP